MKSIKSKLIFFILLPIFVFSISGCELLPAARDAKQLDNMQLDSTLNEKQRELQQEKLEAAI